MGLLSLDQSAKFERYEAIAGIVKAVLGLDEPNEIADSLKVTVGVMNAVVRAKNGRLVIYDRKANRFVTRDPDEGGFDTRKDADELRRQKAVADAVFNYLDIKDPEQLVALLATFQRAARRGEAIQFSLTHDGPSTAEVIES